MAEPAVIALMQAAMRRRLLTRDRAVAVARQLTGVGVDTEAVRGRLQASSEREAPMLLELLPAPKLPPIPGYRRLARLGEGRTASTWLGLGEEPRLVVLKVFHAARVPPGPESDRMKDEARELAGLGSRYLVGYLDARRAADARAVLVEEYVPGRDLGARASTRGPLTEAKALPLLRQAAKGLHVLAHRGLRHGTLHPGNILVDADGRARVSDYALAISSTRHALRPGWDARTLLLHAFAAPELLTSDATPTPAADQYALGCIAWWLLAGRHPFGGDAEQQARAHATAPRPDLRAAAPRVGEATAHAVRKAMDAEPGERFPDSAAFAVALHRAFAIASGAQQAKAAGAVDVTPLAQPRIGTTEEARAATVIEEPAPSAISAPRPAVRPRRRRRR